MYRVILYSQGAFMFLSGTLFTGFLNALFVIKTDCSDLAVGADLL